MHKLLYLFGNYKNLHKFGEKRLVKVTETTEGGGPLSEGPKLKGKAEVREEGATTRREVQDATATPLEEKEVLAEKLKSLKDPELSAILDKGQIDIEVEIEKTTGEKAERIKEKRSIKLEALAQTQIEGIIHLALQADDSKANFEKIIGLLDTDKINIGQLNITARRALLKHSPISEENLGKLLKALVGPLSPISALSIGMTIEACDNDKGLIEKIFNLIPKESIQDLNTDTIVTLINAGLYKQLIEALSDNQKAELLLSQNIENPQIKIWLFEDLFGKKGFEDDTKDAKIVNALITYCVKENDKFFKKFIVPALKSEESVVAVIAFLDKSTAKILIEKLESSEADGYPALLTKIKELLPQSKLEGVAKLKTAERTAIEKASTTAFFSEFPTDSKTSFENRIKAAFAGEEGVTIGKSLVFSVGGVQRSFRITKAFKTEIEGCSSPAEVKKACYEHLLSIITKDGSIRSNRWKLKGKVGESNQELVLEIERLQELIAKEGEKKLTPTEEAKAQEQAKRKAIILIFGEGKYEKGNVAYEITKDGEIIITGDPQATYAYMQKKMGATPLFSDEDLAAAQTAAGTKKGDAKTRAPIKIAPKTLISKDVAAAAEASKEPKLGEAKDNLENLQELQKIITKLLEKYEPTVKIDTKLKRLEITLAKRPDGQPITDARATETIYLRSKKDGTIDISYNEVYTHALRSSSITNTATNEELFTFITHTYEELLKERDTHMGKVDYFFNFKDKDIRRDFNIKDEQIQVFDEEQDNSKHEWEKNWERISGHEKIEAIFKKPPFNSVLKQKPYNSLAKKDQIPAIIRDIVQEGSNSIVEFDDLLEITNLFPQGKITELVKLIEEVKFTPEEIRACLGSNINLEYIATRESPEDAFIDIFKLITSAIIKKDLPEGTREKLQAEKEKLYSIYIGSVVILETLEGATLQEPKAGHSVPAGKAPVVDSKYQYVGNFDNMDGESIPVYTAEGKLYQSAGTEGKVKPLIDPTVRVQVEKAPQYVKAQEKSQESIAKREYLIGLKTRIDKLKIKDKENKEVTFKTEIKDTKVEISFPDNKDPNFPKFYFEPELEYDKEKDEWTLKNLKLEHERYFVGDMYSALLGPNPTNEKLSDALGDEYRKTKEDADNYQEFAKIDLTKFEIAGIGEDDRYTINDPKIAEFADGDEDKWANAFGSFANHETYTKALGSHFGVTDELQSKHIMYEIIQRDSNSRLYFNDILEVTQTYKVKDSSDNVGIKSESFGKHFNFLLRLLKGGKLKTTKPDGSPDTAALEERDKLLAELRGMYNMYIGGMKILKSITTDTYKPASTETPSQHLKYQIDELPETKTQIYGNIYYNFDELVEGKAPEKNTGKTQIGLSSEAYTKFIDIYRKALGKEDKVKFPDATLFGETKSPDQDKILRTLLRAYTPQELLTTKGLIGKEPKKDDVTRLILLDFPANFTANQPQVKFLMEKFHEKSLGEEPNWGDLDAPTQEESHQSRLAETQEALSTDITIYKAKMLELLKRVEQRDKDKVMQWIFSDAVDINTEMTGSADVEHYDAGDIRRFTSPEAMIQHLFDQGKVKIRPFNFETGRYGKEEEISIFKFENGVQKINEEGLVKYFNYLIQEGLRRKKIIETKQEQKYDFGDAMGDDYQVGTWGRDWNDKSDLTTEEEKAFGFFKAFMKNPTKETWEKIPGYERINKLLTKSPFGLTEEEIPGKMHELLKDNPEEIQMEKILDKFLKTSLEKYKPINTKVVKLDKIDNIKDEYNFIKEKAKELQEKIKENKFEGTETEKTQKREEAKVKLMEYSAKYLELMTYVDAGSALLQRIGRLGEKVPKYDEIKLKIPEGGSFLGLKIKDEQIDVLNGGYVSEMMKDEAAQLIEHEGIMEKLKLSEHPNIKKIQESAIKAGYPIEKVGEIETKILGAGIMNLKGNTIAGGGLAIPISLSEDFTLILAGTNNGVGLGFYYNVVKTEDYQGALSGGVGVGFDGKGFASLAYINTHKLTDTVDFSWGFGILMTATGPAAMVGLAFHYNEKRATEVAIAEENWKDGYDEIEKAKDLKAKAKLIRELPEFKQQFGGNGDIGSQLDDQDVIATYEEWRNINIQEGFVKGRPPTPFTGFGIGATFPPPGGFIGLKIRLGETVLIKPRIGERERLAQVLSASAIRSQIDEKLKQTNPNVTFEEYKSKELYTDSKGRMGVREATTGSMQGQTTDLGFLNKAFEDAEARMKAEAVKIKVGKPGEEQEKSVVELKLLDTDNKDVCVYVDNDCPELAGVILNKDGRIYIPETIDNLVITKETFKYPYRKTGIGNATTDVIIITTNPHFDRNTVIKESKTFLEKRWEEGKPKQWQISKGYNTAGTDQIHALEDYQGEKALKWSHGDYTEKTFGMPVADFKELGSIADETTKALGGETKGEIEDMDSRFEPFEENGKPLAEKIYKKLVAAGLKRGGALAINDTEAIVAKTNEILGKMKPKQEALNTKEAGQLISLIQHLYFVNIWAKGGEKEVIAAYRQNNEKITKDLAKAFVEKFDELEITPPEGMTKEAYALQLTQKIQATAEKNFLKTLEDLKTTLSKDPLTKEDWAKIPISDLLEGTIFYSGTTVRHGKRRGKGLLAGGAELFDVPDVPKMGLIGKFTEGINPMPWKLDSENKEERDIAKLILETVSPRPKIENLDTFYKPLALKLATFEGTGIEIGKDNFKKLSEFYQKTEEEQEAILKDPGNNVEFHTALKAFIEFTNKVRDEMTSGSKAPLEMKLRNGTKMLFGAQLYTGSYGECGNLSIMAREEFVLINQANVIVASTSKYIHAGTQMRKEVFEFCIGVSYEGAPDKEKAEGTPEPEGEVDGGPSDPGAAPKTDTFADPKYNGPGVQ